MFTIILIGYFIITLIALPFQYRYIVALERLKEENKDITQGDMYDSLQYQELVLHANAQGNFLFVPANIMAKKIYKLKHKA